MDIIKLIEKNKKALLICWTIAILVLTLFPLSGGTSVKTGYFDKVVHAILFGVFAVLFFINSPKKYFLNKVLFLSFFSSLLFAAIIEFLQNFFSGRSCDIWDFLAGIAGATLFLSFFLLKKSKSRV